MLGEKMDYQKVEAEYQAYRKGESGDAKHLSEAINRLIGIQSQLRKLARIDMCEEDVTEKIYTAAVCRELPWILPSMGQVSQDIVDVADIQLPLFSLQASKNWKWNYSNNKTIETAVEGIAKAIIDYEKECLWRVIIPAVTTAFDGCGVLPSRPAQLYEMPVGDPTAGYFSKEIVNRMIVGMCRLGKTLKTLWLSPEDLADIREYTEADVDPITRREIFEASGLGHIWGINLEAHVELGIRGIYNIHGKDSSKDFCKFQSCLPKSEKLECYNDLVIAHPNVVDENGQLEKAGETQFYGFSEDLIDNLVMPLIPYQAIWDAGELRKQRSGFYGWQKIGLGLFDASCISMGIVDRSMEDMQRDPDGYMRIKPKRRFVFPTPQRFL
jgi:hypothetical protein